MRAGELICVVTDGVADTRNPAGERYSGARLAARLASVPRGAATAQAVVAAVADDLRAFAGATDPADDVTVLALRWLGPHGAATPPRVAS
jgi:serine phosphatase RsbU (regulator of sigma subunit)